MSEKTEQQAERQVIDGEIEYEPEVIEPVKMQQKLTPTTPEGSSQEIAASTNIQPQAPIGGGLARSETEQLINAFTQLAMNPEIPVERMMAVMDMQDRVLNRQAEMEFNAAMNKAQGSMRRISADAQNPQTRSQYASYAQLDRALRPIYTDHGFALSFDTKDTGDSVLLVLCYVSHSGGFTRTYSVPMPADGKGAKGGDVMTKTHATGSAMTYGMRYLLKLIFNVAVGVDDDDGNAATAKLVITDAQATELHAMVSDAVGDDTKTANWMKQLAKSMGYKMYTDIPVDKFDAAKKILLDALKQKGYL